MRSDEFSIRRSPRFWAVCLSLSLVTGAAGAVDLETEAGFSLTRLFPGAVFDPAVPTQIRELGFNPGSRPLRHAELIRYLEALAESSPRAELRRYSTTHEGRPMVYLVVSDEETMGRLRAFRKDHEKLTDPRGRPASEDAALIEDAKAVAWMAYSIHGDELSGVDSSAALAYWLVAGEDELAARLRKELVILIDPCENPDGRERFLAQTTAFAHAVPSPDTEDLSHTTVWPWGRGNHYLFDLNRDWFTMVQPESRRSEVIVTWNPQLMVDAHEMGPNDTYLFSPPRHPFNPLIPHYEWEWSDRFAADQARALDDRGYGYYTREWNEEFFPGYGSSWPSYRGAIGILYEQSSTAGTRVLQRSGTVRTFPEAVEHQLASSVANLRTLASNRVELLSGFVASRRKVLESARSGMVAAWVLPEGRYPERTRRMVRLLRGQGIEVLRSTGEKPQVSGLRDSRTGDSVDAADLPETSWMVPVEQPSGPLVRVLLDPHVPMESEFLQEEREYLERRQGTRMYEISAWSLPLSYGVEAYWTGSRPTSGWSDEPIGKSEGTLGKVEDAFGYMMAGASDASVHALADLLQRGIAVRVAGKPVEVSGLAFDRGAVLIKREGNPDDLAQQLDEVARRWDVEITGLSTAKASSGPDLGGQRFLPLQAPRVGILTGDPISTPAYGALWHLLDQEVQMRFTGLVVDRFARTDLSRYNVLIFPPSRGYARAIDDRAVARLKTWIEAGGTAIGIGSGADFLADKKLDLTRTRLRRQALAAYPSVVLGLGAETAEAAGRFSAVGVRAKGAGEKSGEGSKDAGNRDDTDRSSPYDVAPILGPGASPFAKGVKLGTPGNLDPVGMKEWLAPLLPPGKEKPEEYLKHVERADERLRRFATRGTFMRVDLDPQLWLSWGAGEEVPALVRTGSTLIAKPPVDVPARFAEVDRLHLGGLLWPETAGRIALTAYATRESVGRGQVVLFPSEPEFRGWTLGTRRLLLNAVLYGPGLGTRWSSPW